MNGRELTADDVVFNFHRLLGLGDFAEAGPSPFTYQRPPGESVTATDRYTVVIRLAEPNSAATYWAEVGVDVEINTLDGAPWSAARRDHTWEGLMWHPLGWNGNPMVFIRGMVHSSSMDAALHGIRYPELDALVEAAEATTSEEEQQELVKEVDLHTMENHWWIWGPKTGKYMAYQPWVVGFNGETWLGFMDRLTLLARLWIDSELKAEMGN